jgi:Iron-containing redox enzyme
MARRGLPRGGDVFEPLTRSGIRLAYAHICSRREMPDKMNAIAEFASDKLLRRVADEEPHVFHARLLRRNACRLAPALPSSRWIDDMLLDAGARMDEGRFVERERHAVAARAAAAPTSADAFLHWFENLHSSGPGQGDALFPWLASEADLDEMRWFLTQEAAGEAGFDDLVALTQVRFPTRAKLEMARNYWDEMGRGNESGMHGPMLAAVVSDLDLRPTPDVTVWESLALANLMVALAANRRYAYHAIGALGVIEMTAPTRVGQVNDGLRRLGVPSSARIYFQLHAGLDVKHSLAWNREVIGPLVADNPAVAPAIAEGALMRLEAGARCFARYRAHFGLACQAPGAGRDACVPRFA